MDYLAAGGFIAWCGALFYLKYRLFRRFNYLHREEG